MAWPWAAACRWPVRPVRSHHEKFNVATLALARAVSFRVHAVPISLNTERMEASGLASYVHTVTSEIVNLCKEHLAGTPLEPLLTSRYVSWASVIGMFVGGVAYAVSPGVLLQTPRKPSAEQQELGDGPPPVAKTSTTARLCFDTEPQQMLDALRTCPAGGGIDQQDANGWTALMWSAHWSASSSALGPWYMRADCCS